MAQIDLGLVRPAFKGEFSTIAVYNKLEWVTYNGGSYQCLVDSTPVGTLPTNTDYWAPLADPNAFVHKVQANGAGKSLIVGNDNNIKAAATATYIKRNTAYAVGARVYSEKLGAGEFLVCTQAGTTGTTEPDWN